jgi:hypothetical protein
MGWPQAARSEFFRDMLGGLSEDPGVETSIEVGLAWLRRAQDCSKSHDGGVARHFSLLTGWSTSYPETTGYIIPTFLEHAHRLGDAGLRLRARRMLDWLVEIQLPEGAFQGSTIGAGPVVPTVFDTGQILMGLSAGVSNFGETYLPTLVSAADWLVRIQNGKGVWDAPNFFVDVDVDADRPYETHVAWGMLEAAKATGNETYKAAAVRNIDWALQFQQPNGWFASCCLDEPKRPVTHTIGYALRGVIEGYLHTGNQRFLDAAILTANALLTTVSSEGRIPGRLKSDWSPGCSCVCVTGSVQIAACWLLLYKATGDVRYRNAGFLTNQYVRRTLKIEGSADVVGGVKGSFPVAGGYLPFQFLNWACKFMIDSCTLELEIRNHKG